MAVKKAAFVKGRPKTGGRQKGSSNKYSLSKVMTALGSTFKVIDEIEKMSLPQFKTRVKKVQKSGTMQERAIYAPIITLIDQGEWGLVNEEFAKHRPVLKPVSLPIDNDDWKKEILEIQKKSKDGSINYDDLMASYSELSIKVMDSSEKQEMLSVYFKEMSDMLKARESIEYGKNNAVPVTILNEVLQAVNDSISVTLANRPVEIEKFRSIYSKKIEAILGDNLEDEPKKRASKKNG